MQTCEPFDVVAVPFPYIEREVRKRRPTLVVCSPELVKKHGLLWVLMITSAAHPSWSEDVPISDLATAGLPKPSVVRVCKIATVEAARCERIGRLADDAAAAVAATLRRMLAGVAPPAYRA
jgi:mRNA interferase MazF